MAATITYTLARRDSRAFTAGGGSVTFTVSVGARGVGVPVGGTTGQVLAKASGTDYDSEWVDQTGGGGSVTGILADMLVLGYPPSNGGRYRLTAADGVLAWASDPGPPTGTPTLDFSITGNSMYIGSVV